MNLYNDCPMYFVECVRKIKHILSVIHYTIYGDVYLQFTRFPCDNWMSIVLLPYATHQAIMKLVYVQWRMNWPPGTTHIARFMGPTRGRPGSCRPQVGPMLAPWTSLSGKFLWYLRTPIACNLVKYPHINWFLCSLCCQVRHYIIGSPPWNKQL